MIDRDRAFSAVSKLERSGIVTVAEADALRESAMQWTSMAREARRKHGDVVGTMWLAEEREEKKILSCLETKWEDLSVAEWVLMGCDTSLEPWHEGTFVGDVWAKESAEPWHFSLSWAAVMRGGGPVSGLDFFKGEGWKGKTESILRAVYGKDHREALSVPP